LCCLFPASVEALFGNKRRKQREAELLAKKLAAEAAARQQKIYIATACVTVILVGIVSLILFSGMFGLGKVKKSGNRPDAKDTVDVVVVGCGLPKKSMVSLISDASEFCSACWGCCLLYCASQICLYFVISCRLYTSKLEQGWYHTVQLLEMTNVNVLAIVEPFFMNRDLCRDIPASFMTFLTETSAKGVMFTSSVEDLQKFQRPTLCLIAARTADNPKLLRQCIEKGAKFIFLEKPGAPSVEELRDMKMLAVSRQVKVFMGFNKHVTPYVRKAIALSREVEESHVFFCHNNSYETKDLAEVFTRNPEGIMKNMCIHELALLNSFFGVSVETIAKFKVNTNALFTQKLTVWQHGTTMPNPKYITDFSRCAFKITTIKGKSISVMADRCGGNISFAVVKDSTGAEVKKFEFPDQELLQKVDLLVKEDPEMMPYFFIQSDDYLELKNLVVESVLGDSNAANEVATIDTAIEALRLAEYCTQKLESAVNAAT
jgi:predicted dehydrogenase